MHWASKTYKYKRELTDWVSLCATCHKKYDWENGRYNNKGGGETYV